MLKKYIQYIIDTMIRLLFVIIILILLAIVFIETRSGFVENFVCQHSSKSPLLRDVCSNPEKYDGKLSRMEHSNCLSTNDMTGESTNHSCGYVVEPNASISKNNQTIVGPFSVCCDKSCCADSMSEVSDNANILLSKGEASDQKTDEMNSLLKMRELERKLQLVCEQSDPAEFKCSSEGECDNQGVIECSKYSDACASCPSSTSLYAFMRDSNSSEEYKGGCCPA